MRLVLPVSAHDAHLLEQKLALLRHFGRLENHSIIFSPAQSVAHMAEEAAVSIGDLTSQVTVLPLAFEGEGTWPQSPNLHWVMTMEALRLLGGTEPIFWMELDCDPIKPNWADLLETDWRKGRHPFCGKIVPKPSRNAAGAIVYEPDDLMMMGCGIYPANITQMRNWDVLVKGIFTGTNPEPFDVFMRGWMRALGWSHTDLIGDRWNTINYRGGMLCDPGPTEFKSRDHSKTDISGACVIHGCKDGSLGRLILESANSTHHTATSTTINVPLRQPAPQQAPPPAAPQRDTEFERHVLESLASIAQSVRLFGQGIAALNASVKEALAKTETEAPQEPAAEPEAEVPALEPCPAAEPAPKPKADIETIRGMVNASEKAQRIGQLAKVLKVKEERLRKMIVKPDSGLIIRKGYVRLADAA